ncbi:activator of 90 kDa heat shock protein ATPase homolog 1-like [Morone saxatilis]|uniref:activator of 90 kDa heat shock protein ATPase homolog 1-like n=1 Tax=Morone saxatilis TaxID=34816 RepID=UPI0015E22A4E|nr:activator of 90 kDa heat shock protein ATPase homolog 1-like [Morone saxatilis]
MAKWGEGDPRWIVEERADATNVNNWHWTERDVSGWSSERLRQLLLAVQVKGPEGVCQLTDVSKLDGEASINNRKGKLIFFYEWQLRANWLGTSSSGLKYRGTVDVSNLSDENDTDDLDISVSLCKDQPSTPLLDLMRRSGVQEVRRALGDYICQLKSEFSQGMILPTTDGPKPPQSETRRNQIQTSKTQISPAPRSPSSSTPCPTGVRISTCSFSLKETFQTSPGEVYRTFINQEGSRCRRVVNQAPPCCSNLAAPVRNGSAGSTLIQCPDVGSAGPARCGRVPVLPQGPGGPDLGHPSPCPEERRCWLPCRHAVTRIR